MIKMMRKRTDGISECLSFRLLYRSYHYFVPGHKRLCRCPRIATWAIIVPMIKKLMMLLVFSPFFVFGQSVSPPFNYDLHLSSLPGSNNRVMICFHGYGDNYKVASWLKKIGGMEATLISFNFPEHNIKQRRECNAKDATFGTIDELLPALYVMKQIVLGQGVESIDLYGFSAGGGALINAIGVLNTSTYDTQLKKIEIGIAEKKKLLTAIQKGIVILDTPLKSIEEIIDFRGPTEELEILAKNYRDNNLRPIDSLKRLKGLSLDVLVHFQENDEILSNRDDAIYIEHLKENLPKSKVTVIIGNDGGHMVPHFSLWQSYSQKIES